MNRFTGFTFGLMLCIVSQSFAQEEENTNYISKGQWMAGGKLSLSTGEGFENYTFSVSPMGGYFLGKKVAVGINSDYSFTTFSIFDSYSGQVTDGTTRGIGASLFVRDYFSTGKIAPFIEFMGGARWSKQEINSAGNESTSKNSFSYVSAGVGLNYFISHDVALEGILRYTNYNGYEGGLLDFDLGLQFFPSRKNKSTADEEGNYFSKNQWLIGGTGNILLGALDNIDPYFFSISPMAGYLIGNKIAVGLSTGYAHTKGTTNSFFAAPFFRYYLTQKKLAPYAEVAYGQSWTRVEYVSNNEPVIEKLSSSSYRIGVGLNYFISKNVALDGNLRYARNIDSDLGSLSFSVGLQFFIR